VTFFETEDGEVPAEDFLVKLDKKMRAKMTRAMIALRGLGPELREPYSKHLDNGIFELRARVGSNISRVLYFFIVGKRAIITHGFIKKTQKTPPSEINKAKSYRMIFLEREAKSDENT